MYKYVRECVHPCMYACIQYVCIHVCMHACMHASMYVCMSLYVCMYVCMHVCVYVCMSLYVCMYVCMYVCVCVYVCMYVCMHVGLYLYCMYVHVYVVLHDVNEMRINGSVRLFRGRGGGGRKGQGTLALGLNGFLRYCHPDYFFRATKSDGTPSRLLINNDIIGGPCCFVIILLDLPICFVPTRLGA